MSLDTNQLPISGGVFMAAVLYAALHYVALGPLVATRTIEVSGWDMQCKAGIDSAIQATRTPARVIPKTDCHSMLGGLMPELGALCQQFGNPDLAGPAGAAARAQERLAREAESRRLDEAMRQSETACGCAANLVAQDPSWAVHAGSLRLVTPPTVQNLSASLGAALRTPQCGAGGAGLEGWS